VIDSIAVLRSVLMLDTPTRRVLAGGIVGPHRQPNFSPGKPKTPESRKSSPVEKTPIGKPPMAGKRPSPGMKSPSPTKQPPSPEMQRITSVLQRKVHTLEASHGDLEKRFQEELHQRTTLEAAHKKLAEIKTQQTSQLEQITASRDELRDESAELKKTIETERVRHSSEIARMETEAKTMIESQRAKDEEIEMMTKKLRRKEERYLESESLVKSLTKEVEKLNTDLKATQQKHKAKMQSAVDGYTQEITSLKEKLQKMESNRVDKTKKDKAGTEQIYTQLQQIQIDMNRMKQEHSEKKEKLESGNAKLRDDLTELAKRGSESVQQLMDATNEVTLLQKQLEETHTARISSEEKLQDQIIACDALRIEKEELERRLRDTEDLIGKKHLEDSGGAVAPESKTVEKTESEQDGDDSEKKLKSVQKQLEKTQMELEGLKENLDEAERIEFENEKLQRELYENERIIEQLRRKLEVSELSNSNRLEEVATHREKSRMLEDYVQELEDGYGGEGEEIEEIEKKRDNSDDDDSTSPRKRLKMRIDIENENNCDDDIVL